MGTIPGAGPPLEDLDELRARLAPWRGGGRIVFTNGCFDLLHAGHVAYLTAARSLGDVLVVGVNSDGSVRRLKGPGRPLNPLEDRAAVLGALRCVDHLVAFDAGTPLELLGELRPDVYVKGGDYRVETLPEAPLMEELGGEVVLLPYLEGRSTSGLLRRLRDGSART
jgi:D-beta-D-heptose 7-phosphate kinase / D-beta-D-heptose 1-phosphate adenosyltransferase